MSIGNPIAKLFWDKKPYGILLFGHFIFPLPDFKISTTLLVQPLAKISLTKGLFCL
jgi:hypothetical protein